MNDETKVLIYILKNMYPTDTKTIASNLGISLRTVQQILKHNPEQLFKDSLRHSMNNYYVSKCLISGELRSKFTLPDDVSVDDLSKELVDTLNIFIAKDMTPDEHEVFGNHMDCLEKTKNET